tara:strand:+ start:8257 stop:8580 length:324 start_codon:yes stop_codon:yes gene_type:complete
MDNLTICKKIAEIEGVEFCIQNGWVLPENPAETNISKMTDVYNPLTDDALCFQLMLKYDMPPMKSGAPNLYECVFDMDRALSGAGIICDESPNKAICLAIIEAHKDL